MTKLEIWWPKYSAKYDLEYGEKVALLHRQKVYNGSPVIIVEFTKAKDLAGQRFAIMRKDCLEHEIGTNGAEPNNMYIVPMSHLEPWETVAEIKELVNNLFDH